MAWRNRIAGGIKGRSNHFRKMNEGDEDYDMPLLVQATSSLISTPSPRSSSSGGMGSLGFKTGGLGKSSKNNINKDSNIAAVPHEIEALSFPEDSDSSPVPIVEDPTFVAQFHPEVTPPIESKGEAATVFDDDSSDDESVFTTSKHDEDERDEEEIKSLRPPSLTDADNYDDEQRQKETSTESITNSSLDKSSKLSRKSRCGGSNSRLSSSSKNHRNYMEEDADAATWNADDIDAFVDADDFGNSSVGPLVQQPMVEISGVELLTDRENAVNELQEINHLMTFNSLVLIQKQKNWIEGSIDATNGANRGSSGLVMMELQNLERKIKLLMDNREWPNEREREKQKIAPLTPSKAFFKSMALIDKSIEQFHKAYLKYMSNTGEENHELKSRVAELVELNATLQDEASRSRQKTETIRNLQQERDDLTRKVDRTDEKLASLLANDDSESSSPSNNKTESKLHSVKSYIHRLEAEREKHLAEIKSLKKADQKSVADFPDIENEEGEDNRESTMSPDDGIASKTQSLDESLSVVTEGSGDDTEENEKTDILLDDLGSNWLSLQEKEEAVALATTKEKEVKKLTTTVADQQTSIDSLRSECKLMRMQLLELETKRNKFKSQCDMKDSALEISQDRIANLEDEVLRAHARCATYEEDYEALKESLSTQKNGTDQNNMFNSQDEMKAQMDQIRNEFDEKLKGYEEELTEVKEDRDRLIRDLKASVKEIEAQRDSLRAKLAERNAFTSVDSYREEKKESEDDILVVASPVIEKDAIDFEQIHSRFAEKASQQAQTIAQLTEENEVKDEQMKALQHMVEMLLGNKNGEGVDKRQWGQRLSNLRQKSQRKASELLTRSRHGSQHGGSIHGSRHGESMHGSRHGGSMHGDGLEEYSN